jgi:hypothetical protein
LEKGKETIYLQLKKSLLLFWQDLSGRLKKRGYILNPYDACVASKWVEESQLTLVWHVDDLKVSHKSEAVLDREIKWLASIYGPLVGSKGIHHTCLGMDLSFTNKKLTGWIHSGNY